MHRLFYVVGFLLFVQTAQAEEPGITPTEIKLGGHAPLTGPLTIYGTMPLTARAYFRMINDQGGINGRKIDYTIEDNAYDSQKALEAVKKLAEVDKVFAYYGNTTVVHVAAKPYVDKSGIPDMFFYDASEVEMRRKNAFACCFRYWDDGAAMAKYAQTHLPGKKIAVLYSDTTFGTDEFHGIKATLGSNANIVAEEKVQLSDNNADSQVLNMMNAGAEVVLASTIPNMTVSAMKLANQKGWKPKWIVTIIDCTSDFEALGGADVEGAISPQYDKMPYDQNDPAVRRHVEMLKKYAPDVQPSGLTIMAQVGAELMVEALKRAGRNLTRAGLVKAAESISDFTPSIMLFPVSLAPPDHLPAKTFSYMVMKNGRWVFTDDAPVKGSP